MTAASRSPNGDSTDPYATSRRPSSSALATSRPAAAAAPASPGRERSAPKCLLELVHAHTVLSFFRPSCTERRAASSEQPITRPMST